MTKRQKDKKTKRQKDKKTKRQIERNSEKSVTTTDIKIHFMTNQRNYQKI